LPERVVTIIGEKAQNRKALEMILTKVQEDPLSASCLNISYGDVQGLVANPNPTGSPFASVNPNAVGTNGVIDQRSPNKVPNSTILPNTPFSLNLGNGRSLDLRFNSVPGWPTADPSLMNQFLQQMTSTLRALGFTENTIEEIIRSIGCLATHGILTLSNPVGSTTGSTSNSIDQPPCWPPLPPDSHPSHNNSNRAMSPSSMNSSNNSNTYGLVTNQNENCEELEIDENVVGAVIGPAGRSIVELQQFSGARIQVSKKGNFSPGTRNRVVSITGPQQSVATAKYLIEKKIQEVEGRRY
jgi:RNA-binding protein Nova